MGWLGLTDDGEEEDDRPWGGSFPESKPKPKRLSEKKVFYYEGSEQFKRVFKELEEVRRGNVSNYFLDSVFSYMKHFHRISTKQYNAVLNTLDSMYDYGGSDWSDSEYWPEYHDPYFDDIGAR